MKKTLLLFVMFLLAFSLNAQQILKKSSLTDPSIFNSVKSAKMSTTVLRINNSLTENWLVTSTWENNTKTEFTYGTNSEVETTSIWNKITLAWDLTAKTETTFDANGKILLMINYTRSGATWTNSSKMEYAYNAGGYPTQEISWTWNGTTWFGILRSDVTYDVGNKQTLETIYSYNALTSSWDLHGKVELLYTSGQHTQDLSYNYVLVPTPGYEITQKIDFTYNGSGQMLTETSYDWDKTLPVPAWVETDKTEYGYDGAGNTNLMVFYNWDAAWVPLTKYEIVYDVNKRPTLMTNSMWDGAAWVPFTKSETSYTTNQSVSLNYSWNVITSLWDLKTRKTDNYSDVTALERHNNDSGIKIYPNPARDYIVIESAGSAGNSLVQIYDLQGRKVTEKLQSGQRQVIPTANLKTGIYLYKINVNGKVTTGKLFIE
jgi:hypothetical protein